MADALVDLSDTTTLRTSSHPDQLDGTPSTASNGTTSLKENLVACESYLHDLMVFSPFPFSSVNPRSSRTISHEHRQQPPDDAERQEHHQQWLGPVGQNVKEQSAKTASEFFDLANSRTTPDQPAATGQPLTHYHSLFYRLLSWKNPRATAISYVATVLFIFAARYLHILRYVFKGLYIVLGLTATAEAAGKLVFGSGFTSQVRPRKYFTIPKASLERFLDDAEQLINFFVIEFQRVLFAENLFVTGAAFFSALISYWLIKFTPLWGLSLIGATVLYISPLVYIQNKELIDAQIAKGRDVVGQQATQFRDLAAQQTGRASETFRTYAGEYSSKAQEMIGNARGRATSPNTTASVKKEDFPTAPKQDPLAVPVAPKPTNEPVAQAI